MGIDIVGCDINPLAVRGARVNLDHFGMPNVVSIADMRTLGLVGEQTSSPSSLGCIGEQVTESPTSLGCIGEQVTRRHRPARRSAMMRSS